jgi:hypothetical protein
MRKLQDMLLWGTGHWSCRGDVEQYDYWGLQIDEKASLENDPYLEQEKAKEFFKKIYPHFPNDYKKRIIPPIHVPGDPEQIEIPLRDLKYAGKAINLIKEYFPNIK